MVFVATLNIPHYLPGSGWLMAKKTEINAARFLLQVYCVAKSRYQHLLLLPELLRHTQYLLRLP